MEDQKQSVVDLKHALNSTGIKDNHINVKLRELATESKIRKLYLRDLSSKLIDVKLFENNDQNINIRNMFIIVEEKLEKTKEEVSIVVGSITESEKLIGDYKEGIANSLGPQLQELKREGDTKISLASEKREYSLDLIKFLRIGLPYPVRSFNFILRYSYCSFPLRADLLANFLNVSFSGRSAE